VQPPTPTNGKKHPNSPITQSTVAQQSSVQENTALSMHGKFQEKNKQPKEKKQEKL